MFYTILIKFKGEVKSRNGNKEGDTTKRDVNFQIYRTLN
jgi:hypothetical protein